MGGEGSWVSVKNGSWHGPTREGGGLPGFETLRKEAAEHEQTPVLLEFCPLSFLFTYNSS